MIRHGATLIKDCHPYFLFLPPFIPLPIVSTIAAPSAAVATFVPFFPIQGPGSRLALYAALAPAWNAAAAKVPHGISSPATVAGFFFTD